MSGRKLPRNLLAFEIPLWLLSHGLLLLSHDVAVRSTAALGLVALLPGLMLARLLLGPRHAAVEPGRGVYLRHLEQPLLGAGLGYALLVIGMLLLHYVPGRISGVVVLGLYNTVFVTLSAIWLWRRRTAGSAPAVAPPVSAQVPLSRSAILALIIVAALAAYVRFTHLGYAEFQGDEVTLVHLAAEAIEGHDHALFYHKKGPAEILLLIPGYLLTGQITEAAARIPFALANLLGVLGLYAIGRRFFSHRAGWLAAMLIAGNGFYVAFGRIIQYQSLVFFFGVLTVLCALHFSRQVERRWIALCVTFATLSLLAHSDGVFAVLAAALIILQAFRRLGSRRTPIEAGRSVLRLSWRYLSVPALISAAILCAFYVPFALHPQFRSTQGYLSGRLGSPPYNNLVDFLYIGTVYNTIYYYGLLALIMAALLWRRLRPGHRRGWVVPAAWFALLLSALIMPERWSVGEQDLIGVLFAAAVLGLLVWNRRQDAWIVVLIWFAAPFIIYFFGFRDPRTHYYVLFAGASLLVGIEIDVMAQDMPGIPRYALYTTVAAVLAVSLAYKQIMFVSHTPEYRRTYPAHRIGFFWVPFGDDLPSQGLFGFPYRAGWKAIGSLYASGDLVGSYGSNEESHITRWYTRSQAECAPAPTYYFLAENVQDVQRVPMAEIERDYELIGHILVGDERNGYAAKIAIHERAPAQTPRQDHWLADHEQTFDRMLSGTAYTVEKLPFVDAQAAIEHPARLRLGPWIEFLGHRVENAELRHGETLELTLYWQALAPVPESFTVFTHIADPNVLWSQDDGPPGCGSFPTTRWSVMRPYADEYRLPIHPHIPPGPHGLVIGMYQLETGERLPVTDVQGTPLGNSINLGTVTVLPAAEP